jgi:hypothetical protein
MLNAIPVNIKYSSTNGSIYLNLTGNALNINNSIVPSSKVSIISNLKLDILKAVPFQIIS